MRRGLRTAASALCGGVFMFLVALTFAALLTGCSAVEEKPPAPTIQPAEDSPWFDCELHGNQQCGPVEAVAA